MAIEDARALADGLTATIEGTLTTALGGLESARSGFVQDATGGIALYLDAAFDVPLPAGTTVRATGTLDSRFSQRTLRVAAADVAVTGSGPLPVAVGASTGAADGAARGTPAGARRHRDRGAVRARRRPRDHDRRRQRPRPRHRRAGRARTARTRRGDVVVARGPLGQRDSTGTGTAGYRLHATLAGELEVQAPPSPTPTPSRAQPDPDPAPSVTPDPDPVRHAGTERHARADAADARRRPRPPRRPPRPRRP